MSIESDNSGGYVAVLYDGTVIPLQSVTYEDAVCEADMLETA